MQIEFLGAAHEVTGSCHYVSFGNWNFLVDCGMQQGPDMYVNQEIPVEASKIDYVFVTHAHIDHSGLLPLLYNRGFRGKIFCTQATYELCTIMLKDSAHIQEFEAEWRNRKNARSNRDHVEPLYTLADAEGVLPLFEPCGYSLKVDINDDLSVRFTEAGHLLGSSAVELWIRENKEERKLVFSGDLGNGNRPLIRDPEYIEEADYVIIESTYGDKDHKDVPDYAVLLADAVKDTFQRGGNLVIPAFSVGRTQELLYYFRRIKTEHLLPEFEDFEVYIDSPLAIEATSIFHKSVEECFSETAKHLVDAGINPISFPGLKTAVSADESKAINFLKKPVVIISASGMCEAGRIRHHLKHNLWREESTILFVGFQVPGTLGHSLLNGTKEVRLFRETIDVNAKILNLPGISGHADQTHLLKWAEGFKNHPKKFFVVHGDDQICEVFTEHLKRRLSVQAYAPYSGDTFDLLTGEMTRQGNRELAKKKKDSRMYSNVFARLIAAANRLLTVAKKNEGVANKDLAKFADQINALSDKWDITPQKDKSKKYDE